MSSNSRTQSPEVVDLTGETPPAVRRTGRKRKCTFIDLTAQSPEALATLRESAENAGGSRRLRSVYESRSYTGIPPARAGRSARNLDLIELDDSDNDLPSVEIPGLPPKLPAPKKMDVPKCPICLESVPQLQAANVDLVITSGCKHFFCKSCIAESLKSSDQCPRCRRTLRGKAPYAKFFF